MKSCRCIFPTSESVFNQSETSLLSTTNQIPSKIEEEAIRQSAATAAEVEEHQSEARTTDGSPPAPLKKTYISVLTKIIQHEARRRTGSGAETRANSELVIGKTGKGGPNHFTHQPFHHFMGHGAADGFCPSEQSALKPSALPLHQITCGTAAPAAEKHRTRPTCS